MTMKNRIVIKKLFGLFVILCAISLKVDAQILHLYGGQNHDVYLGCLNCTKYDSNSIWNTYGSYGSKYNSKSIWNKYGDYGSTYSQYSPFNNYASHPPVIVDKEGKFYGYFTISTVKSKRADFELVKTIYKFYDMIRDDVSKWYDKIYKQ